MFQYSKKTGEKTQREDCVCRFERQKKSYAPHNSSINSALNIYFACTKCVCLFFFSSLLLYFKSELFADELFVDFQHTKHIVRFLCEGEDGDGAAECAQDKR